MNLRSFRLRPDPIAALLACFVLAAPTLRAAFTLRGELGAPFSQESVAVQRESLADRSLTPVATGTLTAGRIELRVDAEPGLYRLSLGDLQVSFVVGADQTLMVAVANGGKSLRLAGSADQDAYLAYEAFRAESLARNVLRVREAIQAATAAGNVAEIDRLTEDEVTGYQTHRRELNDFTLQNLTGTAALYAASLRWDGDHRLNELKEAVRGYAEAAPGAGIVREMEDRIARFESVALGAVAPTLGGPTPEGGERTLASLRGKYVLVDFRASWCPPCRTENRNYVALYAKYRAAGFEILAVSVDQNGAAWREGIKKDNATWQHISDLTGWKTPLAASYNVSALPASFLMDPEGRILAKDARGARLAALLERYLGRAVSR
jgi:peroxiredoxin